MAYPQPVASDAVVGNQTLWRLTTPLSSPGDIYESDASCNGFAVGPDSDIALVQVWYFDDQLTNRMAQFQISPDRSFVGSLFARNDEKYPARFLGFTAGGRPGRILFASANLYDPSFRPQGFVEDDDIDFEVPVLDVIQYFNDPPSLIPQRSDKEYFYKFYPGAAGGFDQWIVIPYYGRKYASFDIANWLDPAGNITWEIRGVNYSIEDDPQKQIENVLMAPAVVANTAEDNHIVRAAADGMYDALVIRIAGDGIGPAPLRIVVSDDYP